MKKILIAAVAAAGLATPALAANFTGPRVGVTIGIADDDIFGTDATTFGLEAGYDWQVGERAVVGLQAEYQNDFDGDYGRELAFTGRIGGQAGENALVYIAGGYSNLDVGPISLDGVRVGFGAEFALGDRGANLKIEQRYGNYELGAEAFQTLVGVGFRF